MCCEWFTGLHISRACLRVLCVFSLGIETWSIHVVWNLRYFIKRDRGTESYRSCRQEPQRLPRRTLGPGFSYSSSPQARGIWDLLKIESYIFLPLVTSLPWVAPERERETERQGKRERERDRDRGEERERQRGGGGGGGGTRERGESRRPHTQRMHLQETPPSLLFCFSWAAIWIERLGEKVNVTIQSRYACQDFIRPGVLFILLVIWNCWDVCMQRRLTVCSWVKKTTRERPGWTSAGVLCPVMCWSVVSCNVLWDL